VNMTTRTYGFALPLKYEDVKPGTLISALYDQRHVVGLSFNHGSEKLLAVFADGGTTDPRPPYVLDLAEVHTSMTKIPGVREFEPRDSAHYPLLPKRKPTDEGFVITGDGKIGLAVKFDDMVRGNFVQLDFDTGEGLVHGGNVAMLPASRLFVVEPGNDQRREVLAQQSS